MISKRNRQLVFVSIVGIVGLTLFDGGDRAFAQTDNALQRELESESVAKIAADVKNFGSAKRGALAFLRPELNCIRCHSLEKSQRKLGPDLTAIRQVSIDHLIESILLPSKVIHVGYETVVVQTLDGELLSGILVEETEDSIVVDRIEEPEQPLVVLKQEIDQWKRSKISTMPEGLANQLSGRREFIDLIRFLTTLSTEGSETVESLIPDSAIYVMAPLPDYEKDIDHAGLISGLDRRSFERGEEIFRLRCASCHGTVDREGSMPTSLKFAEGKFKHGSDPLTMYKTLTHGYGMMNAQRWMVPRQKYDVIHYVREHFLKSHNISAYNVVDEAYLAGLPAGKSVGPEPVLLKPWTTMDYGPSLNNTIEVSSDGSNIAQKGIAIRLDSGPGGVESGKHWILYDHDTMRVAGVWSGQFIDYDGIHFNGVHGQHPGIAGELLYKNRVGPGFGRPSDGSFVDRRVAGRDGKQYGPLPQDWLRYEGLYRYGAKTVLRYEIGGTRILESPALTFHKQSPVYSRQFNVGPRDRDLVIQVLNTDIPLATDLSDSIVVFDESKDPSIASNDTMRFDSNRFIQLSDDEDLDMTGSDFTIYAEIKTKNDGTIFCQTQEQDRWVEDGQTFFIRGGRLHFDIGWVGDVESDIRIDDGEWHRVAMVWQKKTGRVQFYVDGEMERSGLLKQNDELRDSVFRIGFTNDDFPSNSAFSGGIRNLRFFSTSLTKLQIDKIDAQQKPLRFHWQGVGKEGDSGVTWISKRGVSRSMAVEQSRKLVHVSLPPNQFKWVKEGGDLRLSIPAGDEPLNFAVSVSGAISDSVSAWQKALPVGEVDLVEFTRGGPANWLGELSTDIEVAESGGPFEVDVFRRPVENPWNDRLRLTGIDFLNGGQDAVVCCWDGSVFRVSGIGGRAGDSVQWKRIAAGLFQPLGIRVVDDVIHVSCRDQIVRLHDLNDDGEMDWYENFNSDHQVTEHFHEFAMGLQTYEAGNFYYAKSARHALKAVVPHHGTLLRVSADGKDTEIVANGFRAANGVCLNPDGTFFVTDQEGHWNPKNRINWVQPGGFYGNMYGYHDVKDSSDAAMAPPLCWITNAFDRSPGELLWVTDERWGPLKGRLLNLSYGMGQIFVVPHEKLNGQWQGGMCALPLENFPTGIMRGRFNELDGQLYCCGMFAWAGNQHQPGGFYRVRYTDKPVHLPVSIRAVTDQIELEFSGELDAASIAVDSFRVEAWDLKRTRNYGSDHYNQRELRVEKAELSSDGKTIFLTIADLQPTWCMSVEYALRNRQGEKISGLIHNSIHQIGVKERSN